jgi:hypothetical protein
MYIRNIKKLSVLLSILEGAKEQKATLFSNQHERKTRDRKSKIYFFFFKKEKKNVLNIK